MLGVGSSLDVDTGLTIHDYEFLKGNTEYWPSWGAGFAVVYEYCKNCGYGNFGKPTKRGKKAMEEFECRVVTPTTTELQ